MLGPQFSWRTPKVSPFAHVLFGAGHISKNQRVFDFTDHVGANSFAWALGGGVDVNLTSRFSWRVQPDYLQTNFFDGLQKDVRISTGPVFKIGGK